MKLRISFFLALASCFSLMLHGQNGNILNPISVDNPKYIEPTAKSMPQKVGTAQKSPEIDPAFLRILSEEPPLRIQESIVYLDGSGTSWILCPLSFSGGTRVRWKGEPVRTIQPPKADAIFGTSYGQGALWCTVGSNVTKTLELFRFDLNLPIDGWKKIGVFDGDGGIPSLVLPLKKENRFLGISAQCFLVPGTERASFVGIFRNKEGKLSLESCVELSFDNLPNIVKGEWFKIPNPETGASSAQEGMERPDRFWMGHADPPILTPTLRLPSVSEDFLVLGAASAGVLWFLDLNDGHVRRTINLTGLDRRDLSKISPLKHVILGTGFAPDGGLIVAAKHPDIIKLTVALDLDKPKSPEKDLRQKDFESFRDEIKEINWWRIDPETGSQTRLDSPVDFPERMPTAARQTVFRFLVDPYGHVKTNAFTTWSKVEAEFLASFPSLPESAVPKKDEPNKETPKKAEPKKDGPQKSPPSM